MTVNAVFSFIMLDCVMVFFYSSTVIEKCSRFRRCAYDVYFLMLINILGYS